MPQTRFVLKKALELGHRVVVVVNKVDRPSSRPDYVVNTTFELFVELDATDEQVNLYSPVFSSLDGHHGPLLKRRLICWITRWAIMALFSKRSSLVGSRFSRD